MKDKKDIAAEIKALGKVSLWGVKKEIKNLRTMMEPDEKIIAMLRVFSRSTICLLVATDKRLLELDNQVVYGSDHKETSYLQITGIDWNTRMFFGRIDIEDQSGNDHFDYALNRDLRKFMKVVGLKLSEYRERMVNMGAKTQQFTADEIKKLWALVKDGALTKEEFQERKKQLLAE